MDQQLARISAPAQSQQARVQPPAKSQLWGQTPRRIPSPDDDSDDHAKNELQDDIIDLLIDIAKLYKRMAQPDGVNQIYQKIQSIALQSNDLKFKIRTLERLARRYRSNQQYEPAIALYQTILKSLPTSPQPTAIPPNRENQSTKANDDNDEADDWDWEDIEQPSQYRLTLLIQISVTYNLAGNLKQSSQTLQQARQAAKTQFGSLGELQVLLQVAELYQEDFARYETAQVYYEQASTLAQSLNRLTTVADISLALGEIYLIRGPYLQAVRSYEQALRLYRQTNNSKKINDRLLRSFGLANYHLGNYAEALNAYNQVIEKDLRPRKKARILNLLGTAYQALGQPQTALNFYSQALQIGSKITPEEIPQQLQNSEDGFTLLDTLDRLGTAYQALNQPQKALQSYQQALNWLTNANNRKDEDEDEDTEDRNLKARLLDHLGLTQQSLGQNADAIAAHRQSLAIFHQTRNLAGEASALHNLGLAQMLSLEQTQGQLDLARQSLQQALGLRRSLGDLEGEASTLNALGTVLDQQQQPQLALLFYKQSVNTYESIRQFLRPLDRSLQQSYTDSVAGAYRRLADRLIAQGRIGEAQTTLELLRLQELNDFSRGTRSAQPAPLAYSKTETKLKTQYGSLIAFGQTFYQCESQQCAQLPQLREQLRNLNRDFDKLVQTLIIQQTERATQKTDDFLTSADKIVNVQPHTVLIYPLVLDNKVWLLWAAQGVTGKAECPLDRPTLNQTVATFRQALLDPNSDNSELHPPAQKLYDCLIRPLEPELQKNGIQHLIFVPDRVTNYIPMAALHDGQKYLIERYSIANILSAKLTDVSDRLSPNRTSPAETKPKGTRALAFGLSESKGNFSALPYVPEEIDSIVKSTASDPTGIYPGQTLLNKAFSRTALEDSLNGQQILHIATHAAFVASNPRESYLVLGTGETYPISEIQRLRGLRDVHLVVLSACETGIGGIESNGGIEVSGISSYFLEDRAKAVLASLWKVNDESTSLWMQGFYQRLNQDSITKAESIRQVQLAFLQGKVGESRFIHPYYWAPFVLLGNSW
jgi:CHAT domain-containing protein